MRKTFSNTIEELATSDESILFLTGDLGYNAFEGLQEKLGDRFINMGVAEQNMVSAAAGMAYKGYKVFCYSIAPFIVYRCLEQFRNDVCFHALPVFLIGNGGGYGYGIMGSSHHALEDIACLSGMQNNGTWVPAFNDDIKPLLTEIVAQSKPAYIRLGLGKPSPVKPTRHGSFNCIFENNNAKGIIITLGPIANNVLDALSTSGLKDKFNLFSLVSLPLVVDDYMYKKMAECENILVVEEHISLGGIGQQIGSFLLEKQINPKRFISLFAKGYPGKLYGDQAFHQKLSGLDAENIARILKEFI